MTKENNNNQNPSPENNKELDRFYLEWIAEIHNEKQPKITKNNQSETSAESSSQAQKEQSNELSLIIKNLDELIAKPSEKSDEGLSLIFKEPEVVNAKPDNFLYHMKLEERKKWVEQYQGLERIIAERLKLKFGTKQASTGELALVQTCCSVTGAVPIFGNVTQLLFTNILSASVDNLQIQLEQSLTVREVKEIVAKSWREHLKKLQGVKDYIIKMENHNREQKEKRERETSSKETEDKKLESKWKQDLSEKDKEIKDLQEGKTQLETKLANQETELENTKTEMVSLKRELETQKSAYEAELATQKTQYQLQITNLTQQLTSLNNLVAPQQELTFTNLEQKVKKLKVYDLLIQRQKIKRSIAHFQSADGRIINLSQAALPKLTEQQEKLNQLEQELNQLKISSLLTETEQTEYLTSIQIAPK